MGGCPVGLQRNKNNLNSNQLISAIQSSPPDKILGYLKDHYQINSLNNYLKFLKNLTSRYEILTNSLSQQTNVSVNYRQKQCNFEEITSFHTNKMISAIKICIETQQMIKKQCQQKDKEFMKYRHKWQQNLHVLFQKYEDISTGDTINRRYKRNDTKIQSQFLPNLRIQQQSSNNIKQSSNISQQQLIFSQKYQQKQQKQRREKQIKEQIISYKQKIQKSLIIQPEQQQITQNNRVDLVMSQVQNITAKYQQRIKKLNQQIQELKKQIRGKIVENNSLLREIAQKNLVLKMYQQKIKEKQGEISAKCIEIEKKGYECEELRNKLAHFQQLINNHQAENQLIPLQKRQSSTRSSKYFKKFINSQIIFDNYSTGKQNVSKLDQIFGNIKILSSKLIFCYDIIKPNNMFDYVQNNQNNLIFLGKLTNGFIIGGYSRNGFRDQGGMSASSAPNLRNDRENSVITTTSSSVSPNICFIFSISPHQSEISSSHIKLSLKNSQVSSHCVRLDRNYLRFGTNELRITCGTNKVFSTIGGKDGIFQSKLTKTAKQSEKINVGLMKMFTGDDNSKFQLEKYQIYQLQVYDDAFIEEEEQNRKQEMMAVSQIII